MGTQLDLLLEIRFGWNFLSPGHFPSHEDVLFFSYLLLHIQTDLISLLGGRGGAGQIVFKSTLNIIKRLYTNSSNLTFRKGGGRSIVFKSTLNLIKRLYTNSSNLTFRWEGGRSNSV